MYMSALKSADKVFIAGKLFCRTKISRKQIGEGLIICQILVNNYGQVEWIQNVAVRPMQLKSVYTCVCM